ncbi:GNAT family N-acetyltransferase [Epilithonimonas zeae]|uniref:GNAT family N-acetyltransferase n=1 Tax=Epilithonimonas zeae TaxID=1416779 RepID=UPI0020106B4B|nr:GNAT family N-acetyltransferase [Epilithonimonas zeae]UQB67729.1 N-acetyltransferase [Epilithonimonas zeae]
MELLFENKKSGNGGFITMKNHQEEIGRLTYTIVPELKKLIVSYVMVFPKFEGKGLGKTLVEKSVEFARKNGWTIKAHCSYAHAVLSRKPDVEDVFVA